MLPGSALRPPGAKSSSRESAEAMPPLAVNVRGNRKHAVEHASVVPMERHSATDSRVARIPLRVRTECSTDRLTLPKRHCLKNVGMARGCLGFLAIGALRIVSSGPITAITRIVSRPGTIPIQIDSMTRLLTGQLDSHGDNEALRAGNNRLMANFSTTLVRYYSFSCLLATCSHEQRSCA